MTIRLRVVVGVRADVAGTRSQPTAFSQGRALIMRQLRSRKDGAIALGLLLSTLVPLGLARAQQGGQIVFQSEVDGATDIYVMDGDGTNVRRLTTTEAGTGSWQPVWSPDGSHIVFASDRSGNSELYVISTGGEHARRLTRTPDKEKTPAWSPNGKRIAFVSQSNAEKIDCFERFGNAKPAPAKFSFD